MASLVMDYIGIVHRKVFTVLVHWPAIVSHCTGRIFKSQPTVIITSVFDGVTLLCFTTILEFNAGGGL